MGTRNLTMVYCDGQYRVAQYGQWDGYPSGQGLTALQFARDKMRESEFRSAVLNSTQISGEELKALWKEAGADNEGWVTMEVANKMRQLHPEFSRDTGADILEIVQSHPEGMKVDLDLAFAAESLFCEWAWLIDLDARTFEGYEGFNESRELTPEDRFYFLKDKESDGYHGIQLAGKWHLDSLPTDEEFLDYFKRREEQDEEDDEDDEANEDDEKDEADCDGFDEEDD